MEKQEKFEKELLLKSSILAGKIMLESGAEMNRIEDTMNRIVDNGMEDDAGESFVVPTALFMGIREGKGLRMTRSKERTTNLEKITQVNQLSRQFTGGAITIYELYEQLKFVNQEEVTYPTWLKLIASATVSGVLMLLFDGSILDFGLTCIIGTIGYFAYLMLKQQIGIRFIPDFIASFIIGVLTILGTQTGLIVSQDSVIIGSLMMLVPGVAFTNAIRDFIAGNMISGTIFIVEALFVGIMIGTGITIAFQIL